MTNKKIKLNIIIIFIMKKTIWIFDYIFIYLYYNDVIIIIIAKKYILKH